MLVDKGTHSKNNQAEHLKYNKNLKFFPKRIRDVLKLIAQLNDNQVINQAIAKIRLRQQ